MVEALTAKSGAGPPPWGLAGFPPRARAVYMKKRELRGELGPAAGGPEIEFLDAKPYLLCLQRSKSYLGDVRLSDLAEITIRLLDSFFRLFARLFEHDVREAVLVVFVFADHEAYAQYGATVGLPPSSGGHYEQAGKKRVVIPNDLPDPYATLFHEGTHQLVDFVTLAKGGKESRNAFWFTEGLASYFENFERDPKQGFVFGQAATARHFPIVKMALRERLLVPLAKLVEGECAQVLLEAMRDRTGPKLPILSSESWALTHFLLHHDNGKYRTRFDDYSQREISGQGGPAAFREIFGDPQALEGEWLDYVRSLK